MQVVYVCMYVFICRTVNTVDQENFAAIQTQQFGYVTFQDKFTSPSLPLKLINDPNFRKLNSPLQKLDMFFFYSPPGQEVMSTNLLPVITGQSYTHPHEHKNGQGLQG